MNETNNFEQFMRKHQNLVFTIAFRLLASEAEAKDISQEVFLKAYQRFADIENSPSAPGWLRTVTTNLCLNHLTRYRARWRFFSEFFSGDGEEEQPAYDVPVPEVSGDQLNGADQHRAIEEALLGLPSAQRIPLVLYHFEDLSYEEIAASLKVSLSKVKTDIFRGREALKRRLVTKGAGAEIAEQFTAGSRHPSSGRDVLRVLTPAFSPGPV